MNRIVRLVAAIGAVVAAAGSAPAARGADEIDRLVEEVNPPARFKDYKPRFAIKTVEVRGGQQTHRLFGTQLLKARPELPRVCTILRQMHLLMDGERYVAALSAGNVTFYTGSPAENVNQLLDFDNWIENRSFDIDLPLGPRVKHWTEDWEEGVRTVRIEGGTIRLNSPPLDARIGGGTVAFSWTEEHAAKELPPGFVQPQKDAAKAGKPQARAEHRVTIRVDAVLGYVVEHEVKYRANFVRQDAHTGQPSFAVDYGSFFPHGNTNPWPKYQKDYSYAWQFYTPAAAGDMASGRRFGAWRANGVSVDNVRRTRHTFVKGNGLVGYLKNPAGWGLALTKPENPQDHATAVCPAYGEFYMSGPLPKEPDANGFYGIHVTRRCTGLPPEIADFILRNAFVRFEDRKALQVRLAGEDFEDQPLPFTTPHNAIGYSWNKHPAVLSDEQAHSGKKSLKVKGVPYETVTGSFPGKEVPPVRFDPRTRYRTECWIKVAGQDTEAWVSLHMIGQTRDPNAIGRTRSESVTAGKWKKVQFETTMPPDGLAVILGFVCVGGGQAYFDDFKIEELRPAPRPPATAPPSRKAK
jgi:hypothetical protein